MGGCLNLNEKESNQTKESVPCHHEPGLLSDAQQLVWPHGGLTGLVMMDRDLRHLIDFAVRLNASSILGWQPGNSSFPKHDEKNHYRPRTRYLMECSHFDHLTAKLSLVFLTSIYNDGFHYDTFICVDHVSCS